MNLKALYFTFLLLYCFIINNISGQSIINNDKKQFNKIKYYYNKGNKYLNISPDSSIHYAKIALDLAIKKQELKYIAKCENMIGIAYTNKWIYNKATLHFLNSLKIFEKLDDDYSIALIYYNLGILNKKHKKHKKALENYFKALEIYSINPNKSDNNSFTVSYENTEKENIENSKFEKNKIITSETKNNLLLRNVYENLSITYENIRDYNKAYYYYKLCKQIDDSLFNIEKNKQINELQLKYESSKNEKEINDKNTRIIILEQIKRTDTLKKNLLTVGILSVLLFSFSYIIGLNRKMKLNKQLFENKKLLNEKELENEKLKSTQLNKELEIREREIYYKNKEIEYKNQELINFALNIAKKNELLEDIKKTIINNGETNLSSKTIQIISYNQTNLEKERQELHNRIELINQSFYLKLHEILADITNTEEKLCALIRLKLSSKQIALTLNITPQSVDVYKNRLRKKFNLDKNINLNEFLNSL